jgi:uncharacterized protein YndB with AHSA1/START domain
MRCWRRWREWQKPNERKETAMNELTHDLNKLQVLLDGDTDIIVRRDFSHPPARVWRGLTDPDLIRQWMWAYDYPMTRCDMDLRPGGAFCWAWANADGQSFYFDGTFQEVQAPSHLAHTERFNGDPASGAAITTDLAARGDGTRMTVVMRYADAEVREAAIATGMTDGMDIVYAKLEALL